jgi:hypothetical protein
MVSTRKSAALPAPDDTPTYSNGDKAVAVENTGTLMAIDCGDHSIPNENPGNLLNPHAETSRTHVEANGMFPDAEQETRTIPSQSRSPSPSLIPSIERRYLKICQMVTQLNSLPQSVSNPNFMQYFTRFHNPRHVHAIEPAASCEYFVDSSGQPVPCLFILVYCGKSTRYARLNPYFSMTASTVCPSVCAN